MSKLITSEKHMNSVLRKDAFAFESSKAQADREWAIKKLNELKNKLYDNNLPNKTEVCLTK